MPRTTTCAILEMVEIHALPGWVKDVIFPRTVSGRNEKPLLAIVSGDDLFLVDVLTSGNSGRVHSGFLIYRFSMLAGEFDRMGCFPTQQDEIAWLESIAWTADKYVNHVADATNGDWILGKEDWRDYRPSNKGKQLARAIFVSLWARGMCDNDSKKYEQILHKQVGWNDEKFRFNLQGSNGISVERKVEEDWNAVTFQEFLTLIIL